MTLSQADAIVRHPRRDEAVRFLMSDRAWSAYALGYLDPAAGIPTSVLVAGRPGEPESLVLQAQLPQLLSVYASGDPEGIAAAMQALPAIPGSGVFSVRGSGLGALERFFNISSAYQMRRMVAGPADLRPRPLAGVSRLGIDDLEPVKRLYGMWTDAHQLPGQLSSGIYYGVYRGRDLVAVAGTHCISVEFGVAAVGNVLTHSNHRHRGLASATTTAVAEELFSLGCEEIVLNVRQGNEIAHQAYAQLGFREHCNFIEGVFHSRPGRR